MIGPEEEALIRGHAYLPEHIPAYGATVSGLEPFLAGEYLYYSRKRGGRLVFLGYPLNPPPPGPRNMVEVLRGVVADRRPTEIAVLAPSLPAEYRPFSVMDHYYALDLDGLATPPKVANMIRRAAQELKITRERSVGPCHLDLIRAFCESRPVDEGTRTIFGRIPAYLEASSTAVVFTARNRDGQPIAFDIADFWASHYVFYMFNFRSARHPVPGASDWLLHEIIAEASERNKKRINLGLGINRGVTFFKTKWGARPLVPHASGFIRLGSPSLFELVLQSLR